MAFVILKHVISEINRFNGKTITTYFTFAAESFLSCMFICNLLSDWTVTPIFLRPEPLHYSINEIALFGFVAIEDAFLTPTIGKLADKGYIFIMTNISSNLSHTFKIIYILHLYSVICLALSSL